MSRLSILILLMATGFAALAAFRIAEETLAIEKELRSLQRAVVRERDTIHVANAEWSYLTRPARIAELAGRHLGYRPLTADSFIESSALGRRPDLLLAEYS